MSGGCVQLDRECTVKTVKLIYGIPLSEAFAKNALIRYEMQLQCISISSRQIKLISLQLVMRTVLTQKQVDKLPYVHNSWFAINPLGYT